MKEIITALLLLVSSSAFSQVNYVRNGDFETRTGCPTANNQVALATYWNGIDSVNGENCLPDYCHTCADSSELFNTVPNSDTYWQYPHSGNGMIQANMYTDSSYGNYQNYLQGRLHKKLTIGKQYCGSFYVCLEEVSAYGIKEISAYLDNGAVDTASNCYLPLTRYTPQVTNQGGPVTDTMRWTKIEGSFIATGNERFITIGNFKDRTHTTSISVSPGADHNFDPHFAAYLIDDVAVVESGTKADAGPDTHVGRGDSVYIGRPSAEAIWCDWRVSGSTTIIGKGPGIWVKPTKTTNYECTQTLCGVVTKDTVNVQVWGLGITSVKGQTQIYSLAPNPNNGLFQLSQSVINDERILAEVYNVIGQKKWSSIVSFKEGKAMADASKALSAGIYYLHLKDSFGNVSLLRFLKE